MRVPEGPRAQNLDVKELKGQNLENKEVTAEAIRLAAALPPRPEWTN
jgi:hypothetical protein